MWWVSARILVISSGGFLVELFYWILQQSTLSSERQLLPPKERGLAEVDSITNKHVPAIITCESRANWNFVDKAVISPVEISLTGFDTAVTARGARHSWKWEKWWYCDRESRFFLRESQSAQCMHENEWIGERSQLMDTLLAVRQTECFHCAN